MHGAALLAMGRKSESLPAYYMTTCQRRFREANDDQREHQSSDESSKQPGACTLFIIFAVALVIIICLSQSPMDAYIKNTGDSSGSVRGNSRSKASNPGVARLQTTPQTNEKESFLPTVDLSEPLKYATAENKTLEMSPVDPYLNFTIDVTSKLRHEMEFDIRFKEIKIESFNRDVLVGVVSTNPSHSMSPTIDSVHPDFRRHSIDLFVRSTIILRKGENGFDECSFVRPFTLPLRLHFTLDVRSENSKGVVVEDTIVYDEEVRVCCNCRSNVKKNS